MTAERTVMFALPGQRAVLACVGGRFAGKTFALSAGTFTIGRSPECTLCLADDHGSSRVHSKIWLEGDSWFVADNDSRNGTLVNGKATRRAELDEGDVVTVSTCQLRFTLSQDPAASAHDQHDGYSDAELDEAKAQRTTSTSAPRHGSPAPAIRPAPPPTVATRRPVVERQRFETTPPSHGEGRETPTIAQMKAPAASKPTSPGVIVAAITGGVICAGLLLVGIAVVVIKTRDPPLRVAVVQPAVVTPSPATPAPEPTPTAEPALTPEPTPTAGPTPEPPPTAGPPVAAETSPDPSSDRRDRQRRRKPVVVERAPEQSAEKPPERAPDSPAGADWIAATVDTGAVDVVRSKSKGTVATVLARDGDSVSAGQTVVTFAGGVEGPTNVLASAAGRLDGLKIKPGDGVAKGVMLFRLLDQNAGGLVRAVLPPAIVARARVGASVELKRKKGGTSGGRIVRVSGAAIVVDPGDVGAAQVEAVRVP